MKTACMLYFDIDRSMKLWRKPLDSIEKATAPAHISIDKERCKGCGFCADFCPRDVIKMTSELNRKGYTLPAVENDDGCLGCGFCEAICPEFAVRVSTHATKSDT